MALGIGIDTGGTYTDAVIYDFDSGKVLCSAKALTTHEKLETGIINALSRLDKQYFSKVDIVALSTTLATNACIENKGGRAKLLFFGVEQKVFDMVGKDYGLTDKSDVYLCEKSGDFSGNNTQQPNWDKLFTQLDDWLNDAEGLGIVEVFAASNGAKLEKTAKKLVEERYGIPAVCGHELFYELNSIQRGAGTLLNAKLIPIIKQFLESIKSALEKMHINAPVVVIRSDSTKMSEQYAETKPVETILSGPASSVTGGVNITEEKNCLIIDMGGTTTDVSIVKNGIPLNADSGVRIGSWKTFVHGVFIDTFGLGGDSTIRVEHGKVVQLPQRMIPLCVAATRWPLINKELEELIDSKKYHSYPLYEFLLLQKSVTGNNSHIIHNKYTKEESELINLLEKQPLPLEKAANALGKDIYTFNTERLESEGVIIRAGLTPTDIMHVKKDFNAFDETASITAVKYILSNIFEETGIEYTQEEFCDMVYDTVKLKLYENIVRILLTDKYPDDFKNGVNEQTMALIRNSYKDRLHKDLPVGFVTDMSLVGIGAPTHIFLPDVAKALGTGCVIPSDAKYANAIGAVVSNVRSVYQIEIRSEYDSSYMVYAPSGRYVTNDFDEAVEYAKKAASEAALKDAQSKGIADNYNINTQVITNTATAKKGEQINLGTTVIATVSGNMQYN